MNPSAGALRTLPMFPLGTVLFPYARLPLHVFEPRYRLMVRHVLGGDGEFGVVLIERGSEVGGGDVRFDVATVARVVQAAEMPDGRYALATVGLSRVRVVRWLADDPYPRAEVEALPDVDAGAGASGMADGEARARLVEAFERVVEVARRIDPRVADTPVLDADPARASYEAAALAPIGPLDAQRVLATGAVGARIELLATMLDEHVAEVRARFGLDD